MSVSGSVPVISNTTGKVGTLPNVSDSAIAEVVLENIMPTKVFGFLNERQKCHLASDAKFLIILADRTDVNTNFSNIAEYFKHLQKKQNYLRPRCLSNLRMSRLPALSAG